MGMGLASPYRAHGNGVRGSKEDLATSSNSQVTTWRKPIPLFTRNAVPTNRNHTKLFPVSGKWIVLGNLKMQYITETGTMPLMLAATTENPVSLEWGSHPWACIGRMQTSGDDSSRGRSTLPCWLILQAPSKDPPCPLYADDFACDAQSYWLLPFSSLLRFSIPNLRIPPGIQDVLL